VVQNDPVDAFWLERAVTMGATSIKLRLMHTDKLTPGDAMYECIVKAKASGMDVVVLFNHESVDTDYAEPDLEKCKAKAQEVAAALGPLVTAWEVWNEPQSIEPERDMGADKLMQTLAACYPIFHATGKPVLAAPEWVAGKADQFRDDMAGYWQQHKGEHPEVEGEWPFDIMAVHAYFLGGWDAKALIDTSMQKIAQKFGQIPVWVTEFGVPGHDEASRAQQAQFVQEVSGYFAAHPQVERMFYYALKDYPGGESGAQMGLHDEAGTPKPAAQVWGQKQPFAIPLPALTEPFLQHLAATGAAGQVTKAKWAEWLPVWQAANPGVDPATAPAPPGTDKTPPAPQPDAGPFQVPVPELEATFHEHLAATGAGGQVTGAKWQEWYGAYQAGAAAGPKAKPGPQPPAPVPKPPAAAPKKAKQGGPFVVPVAELEPAFLLHLKASGAAGQVTAAKWQEWYAAFQAGFVGGTAPDIDPSSEFELPRPDLEAEFSAHVQAIDAPQPTWAIWNEWYPFWKSLQGQPQPEPDGEADFTIPRPDLAQAFLAHLEATGAAGQVTKPKWHEWFGFYLASGGS